MEASAVRAALDAAMAVASEVGLAAEYAVVLQNSNRLAVRLLPCDVLARIAHAVHTAGAEFEVLVARGLAKTGSPVGALESRVEPRVYLRDGFAITFWTYYEPVSPGEFAPAEYASALERLHAGMREAKLVAPHFTARVAEAQRIVGNRDLSPGLGAEDRELLSSALRDLTQAIEQRGAPEQLLHGEPHPGNLLRTQHGLLFIDMETCCRGPVEFDIAHAPEEVSATYRDIDRELLATCRLLSLALVAAWRWDRDDLFPDGHRMGRELLGQVRGALRK